MPRRGDRGGSRTRAHIAAVATELFLAHGFDAVTIAEVAAAAGVSKVTVFAHFERKEDLFLDRLPEIKARVRSAVIDRPAGCHPIEALRRAALALVDERHPLSGLGPGSEQFVGTLMGSPALVARLRAFEREVEAELGSILDADAAFAGDGALTGALLVAGYRVIAVDMVRDRLAGHDLLDVAAVHRGRLTLAFDAVLHGAVPRR